MKEELIEKLEKLKDRQDLNWLEVVAYKKGIDEAIDIVKSEAIQALQQREKLIDGKWKLQEKSYQIADTGDYDGHLEIVNNKGLILYTNEDYEDGDIERLVSLMNEIEFDVSSTSHEEDNYGLLLENKYLKQKLQQMESDKLPDKIYIVYDLSDGDPLCAFVSNQMAKNEAEECGCGMKSVNLINE